MSQNEREIAATDRRGFLRGVAGTATGTAALAAGATPVAAQQFDGWFEDVPNYEGEVVDATGQDEVTVEVGVETSQGPYGFGPPAVRIDPGTTVTFSWVSDAHNVLPDSRPEGAGWTGHETIENTGFEFSSTFETEGVYLYYCDPHLPLGMKGAVVVGGVGVSAGGGGGEGDGGGADGGGDGGGGDGEDEAADGIPLTPGVMMVGGGLALTVISTIAFGAFLLLRGGGGPPGGGERPGHDVQTDGEPPDGG